MQIKITAIAVYIYITRYFILTNKEEQRNKRF